MAETENPYESPTATPQPPQRRPSTSAPNFRFLWLATCVTFAFVPFIGTPSAFYVPHTDIWIPHFNVPLPVVYDLAALPLFILAESGWNEIYLERTCFPSVQPLYIVVFWSAVTAVSMVARRDLGRRRKDGGLKKEPT